MKSLLVATSARSTWITAPDVGTAAAVREILGDAAFEVRRHGKVDELAVDVGNGTEAMDAGNLLLAAGYRFRWDPDQHPLNRRATAWGIPVDPDE